jgi:hypothetical protein
MTEITEAQLKAKLSTIKNIGYSTLPRGALLKRAPIPTAQRETLGKRFRHGVDGRRKALELLSIISQPYTSTFIMLNTPFLIWANRYENDQMEGTDILVDSHIEPLNNWAKVVLNREATGDNVIFATDQLNFYFFWTNTTGYDALVNVTSYVALNGSCRVHADSNFTTALWGVDPFSQVSIDAEISIFEWWNEPPTEPLWESSQLQNVTSLSAEGGVWSGDGHSKLFSGDYQLSYNIFRIPSNESAVFEVGLGLNYGIWKGNLNVDFSFEDNLVLCPYLQLQVLTAAPQQVLA